MPRLANSVPKYRKHRASGQALVVLDGEYIYLGPYRSKASRVEYDRVITEWLVNGRQLPPVKAEGLTVSEVATQYWRHAKKYYVKDGRPTGEQDHIRVLIRLLRSLYGRTQAADFGPRGVKAVRQKMIDSGLSRKYINQQIGILCRIFKWAAVEELVTASVYETIRLIPGLKKGRTTAPDHPDIEPVSETDIKATLPHLPPIVADMLRFQRATGARPCEICILRPGDVNREGEVWEYKPGSHKTEHHDKKRVIFIGPKAQDVLRPYLLREAGAFCFSPIDAEKNRLAERHAKRKTPAGYGNRPGTNRKPKRKRAPKDCYTTASYRRAIHRAADKAKIDRWGPNRLRHSAGTEIRAKHGLEGAQVILGHAKADVTQIYAERDHELARSVAKQIG